MKRWLWNDTDAERRRKDTRCGCVYMVAYATTHAPAHPPKKVNMMSSPNTPPPFISPPISSPHLLEGDMSRSVLESRSVLAAVRSVSIVYSSAMLPSVSVGLM